MIVQWERETEQDRGNNGYHLPSWSSNDTAKQMAPSEERVHAITKMDMSRRKHPCSHQMMTSYAIVQPLRKEGP